MDDKGRFYSNEILVKWRLKFHFIEWKVYREFFSIVFFILFRTLYGHSVILSALNSLVLEWTDKAMCTIFSSLAQQSGLSALQGTIARKNAYCSACKAVGYEFFCNSNDENKSSTSCQSTELRERILSTFRDFDLFYCILPVACNIVISNNN